jgi:ABC-type polysaccharide/polyol phosphate transport system ATPase subunit
MVPEKSTLLKIESKTTTPTTGGIKNKGPCRVYWKSRHRVSTANPMN